MAKQTAVVAATGRYDSPIVHTWVAKGARIERAALKRAVNKLRDGLNPRAQPNFYKAYTAVLEVIAGRAKRTARKGGVGRLVLAAAILLGATTAASAGPIVNGDFTQGALGFDTSYTQVDYSAESMRPAGVFGVAACQGDLHSLWDSCGGVGGQDPYMLVNTQVGGSSLIWGQDVGVIPGWNYVLGFFLKNLYPDGGEAKAPQVVVKINGIDQGGVFGPGGVVGWVADQVTFQATSKDTRIEFWSAVWMYTGADLGLDRITLAPPEENLPTPEPISLVLLGSGLLGFGLLHRKVAW